MKIINVIITIVVLSVSVNAQDVNTINVQKKEATQSKSEIKPYYQGEISEVLNAAGYTYLLINEKVPGYDKEMLKSFWITVTKTEAKVGDYVRFKKELVMKQFKSKTLNKTFEEVMFASDLEYRVSN